MARLFVAVWPSDEVVEALAAIDRPERKGLRWTTADQWHITLRFLGHLDAESEHAVRSELDRVDWPLTAGPARLTAGPQPAAIGRAVWALPVSGAEALADAAANAAEAARIDPRGEPRERPFHGHITLARAKDPRVLRGMESSEFHASWEAKEVTLVSSTLHPKGARYEIVARWSLEVRRD